MKSLNFSTSIGVWVTSDVVNLNRPGLFLSLINGGNNYKKDDSVSFLFDRNLYFKNDSVFIQFQTLFNETIFPSNEKVSNIVSFDLEHIIEDINSLFSPIF